MDKRLTGFPSAADRWIAFGVVAILAVLFVPILYGLVTGAGSHPVPPGERAISIMVVALILLTGASVLWSYTRLTDEGMVLRQGIYFRGQIPYDNIKAAHAIAAPPGLWSPGVRRATGGKEVRVVLSSQNLIQVDLKSPQRFAVFGFVPVGMAERVLLNVPNTAETAAYLMERVSAR